jgi:hypothetical protein
MKESYVTNQETANKFAVSLIASLSSAGYQVTWGAVNNEWDIFVSANGTILSRIEILPRNDGARVDIDTEFLDETEKQKYESEHRKLLTILKQHLNTFIIK